MKTRTLLLAATLGAALATLAPSVAHAEGKTADKLEAIQTDGIESRVVDRVWSNTDAYFHAGDYNRIISLLRVCVEADPEFDEAYSCGAWLLWSMGDKPAANAFLDYGIKRAKNKWLAHYTFAENLMVRREYKDALPHLQFATQSPYAPVIAWKQLAHAYEHTGNLKKSLETWQYIVKKFPDEPAAPVNLKRVQGKLGG